MVKAVDKIINKYGLKPICKHKSVDEYDKRKHLPEDVQRLKEWRKAYISDFISCKSKDTSYIENLLYKVAKSEVSRMYSSVRENAAVDYDVIWGLGGHQVKRAKELNAKGISFIWIDDIDE